MCNVAIFPQRRESYIKQAAILTVHEEYQKIVQMGRNKMSCAEKKMKLSNTNDLSDNIIIVAFV